MVLSTVGYIAPLEGKIYRHNYQSGGTYLKCVHKRNWLSKKINFIPKELLTMTKKTTKLFEYSVFSSVT